MESGGAPSCFVPEIRFQASLLTLHCSEGKRPSGPTFTVSRISTPWYKINLTEIPWRIWPTYGRIFSRRILTKRKKRYETRLLTPRCGWCSPLPFISITAISPNKSKKIKSPTFHPQKMPVRAGCDQGNHQKRQHSEWPFQSRPGISRGVGIMRCLLITNLDGVK